MISLLSLFSCNNIYNTTNSNQKSNQNTELNIEKTYIVSNEYFDPIIYESHKSNLHFENGRLIYDYYYSFQSSCSVSLYEYSVTVNFYSSNNQILDTQTINFNNNLTANSDICFKLEVTQEIYNSTKNIECSFVGNSYDKPPQFPPQKYKITFINNNGKQNTYKYIEKGKKIENPPSPTKTNCIFDTWYQDKNYKNKYDFSKSVSSNLTLYAKYQIDGVTITNKISTDIMKSIVKVYSKSYNTFLGIEKESVISQGSGFCFRINNGCYYVLTNCHVAQKKSSYDKQTITIEDYQGNTYDAYIYNNAISPSYDLACLYFQPNSTNVKSINIVSLNPLIDEDIISLGAPKGQNNTITFGNLINYKKGSLSTESSKVTFNVICHNAYINNGSSGGPILNTNLNVVGLNYAGTEDSQYGFSIPAEKINEFLDYYVYA